MYSSIRFRYSGERKKALSHRRQSAKLKDLIANYFIQEGYKQAALALVQEARGEREAFKGTMVSPREEGASDMEIDGVNASEQSLNLPGYSSIDKRKRIKYLILKGDILQAIRVISIYYPTILDENKLLLFKLLRLNLIEMIRDHKFGKAPKSDEDEKKFLESVLRFVRENLISKITGSMDLLRDLEITMSLLCFEFDPSKPADQLLELPEKTRSLFNLSLRNDCYRAVNQVILDSENSSLSNSSAQRIRYKGIPFVDYDSTMLDLLPGPEPLQSLYPAFNAETTPGFQDVSNPKDNTRESLEGMIAFNSAPDQPIAEHHDDSNTSSEGSYRLSRLEEICRLWVATESMLASKNPGSKKSLFDDSKMQL